HPVAEAWRQRCLELRSVVTEGRPLECRTTAVRRDALAVLPPELVADQRAIELKLLYVLDDHRRLTGTRRDSRRAHDTACPSKAHERLSIAVGIAPSPSSPSGNPNSSARSGRWHSRAAASARCCSSRGRTRSSSARAISPH